MDRFLRYRLVWKLLVGLIHVVSRWDLLPEGVATAEDCSRESPTTSWTRTFFSRYWQLGGSHGQLVFGKLWAAGKSLVRC